MKARVELGMQCRRSVSPAASEFPRYTAAEKAIDGAVHALGLAGASVALGWLLARAAPTATAGQLAALGIYGLGLLGMLSASALYNLTPETARRTKQVFRHVDHSMIFVMIAGSYTPFAVGALSPVWGVPLCATIWTLAAMGVGLRLACRRIYDRISLGLYLGMGWLVLTVMPPLATAVSGRVLGLLLLGGIIYSAGSLVHARMRVKFRNVVWHSMVVAGAALHFAAVAHVLP